MTQPTKPTPETAIDQSEFNTLTDNGKWRAYRDASEALSIMPARQTVEGLVLL